ncbi:TIGR04442 family protein [Geopsychrobacter electrodiphilus]|uniref:TIGR04442 family protein n=1 Tax=Geopsychrobacter electrodiphilus TaxID=225196 RepID=UPI000376546D|nr:TIGR04442 family protein [Geopsychrobacter electrodiphilus]
MNTELRLHGHIDENIEFFATSAGGNDARPQFYQQNGKELRFFAPGNEFFLTPQGVKHRGNGGSFCEYMFGVEQPLADLAKTDIRNRLILYGTSYDKNARLLFSNSTDGDHSYSRLFLEGHAIYNTFFFVHDPLNEENIKGQQLQILQKIGKTCKRTLELSAIDDSSLCAELLKQLPESSSIYLFRLIHKKHRCFQQRFRELYFANHNLDTNALTELDNLALTLGIDRYQQERIRIDVMFQHRDNSRIVNEYKKVLISCRQKGFIDQAANARLTRLKTLSVRQGIPTALFLALDELLKTQEMEAPREKTYISETRQILQGMMFQEERFETSVDNRDMVILLEAKQLAAKNRDHSFEHLLLETGKICDEKIRDGADLLLLENFSYIITFFDRFDSSSQQISQLAFMDGYRLNDEVVRSLLGSRDSFESLQPGLFEKLFFSSIEENDYLGRFGRRKIKVLRRGLDRIVAGQQSINDLVTELARLNEEERLFLLLLGQAKKRIRNSYSRYYTRKEQEELLNEISNELRDTGALDQDIPIALFEDVVMHIKKEAVYLHNLLPQIISESDLCLRNDFLTNSGLDRFTIEEIEREYFSHHDLDPNALVQLRAG